MRVSCVLLLAAAAVAGDLLTPGEQVLQDLSRALAAGDDARAAALVAEAGELYRWPASPEEADALLRAAGEASRAKSPIVAAAAVRALGRTGAPAAAAYVERFLRSAKPAPGEEEATLAAIEAAGRLRAAVLVPALQRLAKDSPDLVLADQALLALGEFCGAEPAVRKGVTDKALELCQTLARRRARWDRLRAPGLRALQRLVGRRMNTVGQFTDWWRFARGRPDPFSAAGE